MENATLTELLGPSSFSKEGFLGKDTRSAEEIISEDKKTLASYDIDKAKLVSALRALYVAAERALENPVSFANGTITAIHHDAKGRIPSPFKQDGTFQKGEANVTDKELGVSLLITPLSIHLIDKYDFFQGKGSIYRIEPEVAAKVLQKADLMK